MTTETLIISIIMAVFYGAVGLFILIDLILEKLFWPIVVLLNTAASVSMWWGGDNSIGIRIWAVVSVLILVLVIITDEKKGVP